MIGKLTELEESYLVEVHGLVKEVRSMIISSPDIIIQKTLFKKDGREVDFRKLLRTSSIAEQYRKQGIDDMPLNKNLAMKYLLENLK